MRKKAIAIVGVVLLAAWVLVGYLATNSVVGDHPELRKMRRAKSSNLLQAAERAGLVLCRQIVHRRLT